MSEVENQNAEEAVGSEGTVTPPTAEVFETVEDFLASIAPEEEQEPTEPLPISPEDKFRIGDKVVHEVDCTTPNDEKPVIVRKLGTVQCVELFPDGEPVVMFAGVKYFSRDVRHATLEEIGTYFV